MVVLFMFEKIPQNALRSFSITLLLVLGGFHQIVRADDIDDFIKKSQVKTYDCPKSEVLPQLDTFLNSSKTTHSQSIALQVIKTQSMICVGQLEQAQNLLEDLILDPAIDKLSYSYASAIYQMGYIFEAQDDPKRCAYYKQAEELGKDSFKDITLSSQIAQLSGCSGNKQSIGERLGKLFALLESHVLTNDKEEVAHIHNEIGYLFGKIGQNVLAVEQYQKAYDIGLDVYEEKNQVAPLMSLISAYIGSGNFNEAKLMIDKLADENKKINTPLTNSWLYYSLSRYYYLTADYAQMRVNLVKWQAFLPMVTNKQMDDLFAWYSAFICMIDDDRDCITQYLSAREIEDAQVSNALSNNKDYLRFLVEANLYLGNVPASEKVFQRYADKLTTKLNQQQASGQVLGVANLYAKINMLEENITKIQRENIQTIVLVCLLITVIALLLYLTLGRHYLRKLATDSLTGLRNEQSVLGAIKRIRSVQRDKVNAIAVFDVTNFSEVNAQFGYLTADTLLKRVAGCLNQVTREKDLLGRLGTDRFIVCLKNIDDETARVLFDRIQNSLTDMAINAGSGEKVNIHSSMSMYLSQDGLQDIEQVLEEMRMSAHYNKRASAL